MPFEKKKIIIRIKLIYLKIRKMNNKENYKASTSTLFPIILEVFSAPLSNPNATRKTRLFSTKTKKKNKKAHTPPNIATETMRSVVQSSAELGEKRRPKLEK